MSSTITKDDVDDGDVDNCDDDNVDDDDDMTSSGKDA